MKLFFKLFRYVLPFKRNIVLLLGANLLYACFQLVSLSSIIPFLMVLFGQVEPVAVAPEFSFSMSGVTDYFYYAMGLMIVRYGSFYALIAVALFMLTFSLLSNACRYFGMFWLAPIRTGVMQQLRTNVYTKLLTLPLSFFYRQKKGDLMNRFGSDAQEVEWSIVFSLQTMVRDPFMVIVFLITLLSISVKLTLITVVVLPVSGFLIARIGSSIKRNSTKAQHILGRMSSIFEESIGGLRVIKGYNAIDYAGDKFRKENFQHYKLYKRIFRINELASPMVEILSILSIVVVMLFAGNMIIDTGELRAEMLMFYLLVFARMIAPAKQMVSALYTIQKGLPSVQRIFTVLDADEQIIEKENPVKLTDFNTEIRYQDVSFSYSETDDEDKKMVLNHIDLIISKGEKIAIVGPSGGGKSTLIDLLPRFYDVNSGKILIDGIDIRDYRITNLRKMFSIVNQEVTLFNTTVFQNIAFGLENVTQEEVETAAKKAHADNFINKMEAGYETEIGDRGLKLSGGERQRLSLARAILHNAPVLILDEATSSLDNESEQIIRQTLDELMINKTAIVIAHRLSTIQHSDRIIFIEKGHIIEQGSHNELLALNGEYAKYYHLQH